MMTQANEAHRAKVLGEIKGDFQLAFYFCDIFRDDQVGIDKIIESIALGKIRHVEIKF